MYSPEEMETIILLSSFIFLIFCSSSSASNLRPTEGEREALLAVKARLVDANFSLLDWAPTPAGEQIGTPAHCNWTGVQCDSRGRVAILDLSHMSLAGGLSAAFLGLEGLVRLDVSGNSLTSLPANLSGLHSLQVFDVSDNRLRGHFPAGLGSGSPALKIVNASANDFSGRLPEDLANATALEILDLRGGYIGGAIPASYGNLTRLKFLGLSGNELTGRLPAELARLAALETLIAGYNRFEGPIPAEFGELRELRYLDLTAAGIGGEIPREFANLRHLETAYLFRNRIGGTIPREIGNLTSLSSLDLSDNEIAGEIPEELAGIAGLQLLNLMSNRFIGRVPDALGGSTRLEVLELWNNSLSGPLPQSLGRNSPLRWLDVSTNRLTGPIPPGLCDRGRLEKLILFENEFTGPIPAGLAACRSLVRVRVQENRLDGQIPTGLGWLLGLQRLELAGNDLTGPIPGDLARSGSLSFIDLSRNRLGSTIPSDLLSVPTLQTFLAAGNGIAGGFPAVLRQCPSLAVLDLSGNQLSGPIPAAIVKCRRLVRLNVSGNSLDGEIPGGIAEMPALAVLDLSRNRLSGPIPAMLGASPALEAVNLSYNYLSGPVPAAGVMGGIEPSAVEGNPWLCGEVLRRACGASGDVGHKGGHLASVVAGVAAVVAAAAVAGVGSWWAYRRWWVVGECGTRRWWGKGGGEGEWPWRMVAMQKVGFGAWEVMEGMKEGNVVGMGATGVVYRVELQRHRAIVAVKKLWTGGAAGGGSDGVALGEVTLLGRLRHRNIVRVLGLLHNDSDAMVVYEYVENGSLWEALHGGGDRRLALSNWVARYNVAAGVASGLAYLHHDCRPPVVHRDVKSGNILLDGRMEAKLADFGLAAGRRRIGESAQVVVGSCGYIAPECAFTTTLDEKCDIYSFGVVLMELLTGRKPVDQRFGEAQDLVAWVRRGLGPGSGGRPEDVLDPVIAGPCEHVREEMVLVLRIALLCTATSPKDRPSMRDIVTMLAEAKPRRKSSGGGTVVKSVVVSEKPVFTTAPAEP